MINLLHRNEKFVAAHKKCQKTPPDYLCAKIAYYWSEMILTFLCADSSIQSNSPGVSSFILCSSSKPKNKNLMELFLLFQKLSLGKHLKLDTRSCEFFLAIADNITF